MSTPNNSSPFSHNGPLGFLNPMNLFKSTARKVDDDTHHHIYMGSYSVFARNFVIASCVSLAVNHFLMKRGRGLYVKIDRPRRFFLHTLIVMGVSQYGLEETELSYIKEIRHEGIKEDTLKEYEQQVNFLEEFEKNKDVALQNMSAKAIREKNTRIKEAAKKGIAVDSQGYPLVEADKSS